MSDNFAGILGKVCLHFVVATTVLYFQIAHRPMETDTYYTNDPYDTTRRGVTYTCGCSLPASLQRARNPDASTVNLNICYESTCLETVTVLMYSDSAAQLVPQLESRIKELSSYNITYRTVVGGHRVSQQAHDLRGFINNQDHQLPSELAGLYLHGYRPPETFPSIDYLRGPEFLTFPRSYVRLSFTFTCNNCSSCGLDRVNEMAKNVVNGSNKDDAWATCFPWNRGDNCEKGNNYEAKCLLYPTEALPANFAVKKFFDTFMSLPGISVKEVSGKDVKSKWTTLQASAMYLNVSQVENSTNSIRLGFVEVVKSSALWAWILALFPRLGDCSAMDDLEICNGTSVCNVFTEGTSYGLRCLDMNDTAQCKKLMGVSSNQLQDPHNYSTFANAESLWPNSSYPWLDLECPEAPFKCQKAPPYSLIWNTSENMENDSLNRFLATRILNNHWGQRSGVCTKTYENVLRFPVVIPVHGEGASLLQRLSIDKNDTIFLQSLCTSQIRSSTTYCWLTGRYHSVNDTPEEDWKKMGEDLFPDPDHGRFACYRVQEVGFGSWFITTVGILFGWSGTTELLLKWFVIPLVTKFQAHIPGRCQNIIQLPLKGFVIPLVSKLPAHIYPPKVAPNVEGS